MAAIHFESSIDNSKLNKGIKESEQTVDEFVKHVEKGGGVIGDFASQSAKDMKESITVQKNAIKELQQQIKELENVTKTGGGSYKENLQAQGQLAEAKRNLAGEEATLIQMQKSQVAGNVVEAESQIPIIGGLWKWAAGLATVAAAMKIGKDILNSTEATAHKFEQGIAAAEAATSYFFKTIASGDWSNFFSGLYEAIGAATEYVSKIEEIQNLKNEQSAKNLEYDKEIAIARSKTFDQDKENQTEVLKNIQIVIDKTKQKHAENAVLNKQTYDAEAEKIAKRNGLEADFVKDAVKAYSAHKAQFELGEKYVASMEANRKSQTTRGGGDLSGGFAVMNLAQFGIVGEKAKQEFENWQKLTKDEKGLIKDLYAEWKKEDNESVIGPIRMEMRKSTILKQIEADKKTAEKDQIAAAKKAKEDAELENRIKATQEAMKTASGQKLKDLAAGLVLLEKELALRKQIIDQANMSAWRDQFNGQRSAQLETIGTKPISTVGALKVSGGVLYELTEIDKKGRETFKKLKLEEKELFKNSDDLAKKAGKDQKELDKETEDAAKRKQEILKDVVAGSRQLTGELIDQLGLSEKETKQWQNFADILANAATGNWIGAATGVLSQIIGDLSGANIDPSNRKLSPEEKRAKALDETNKMLERQLSLLQSLSGNDYQKVSAKQAEDLRKANAASLATLQQLESKRAGWLNEGVVKGFSFEDFITASTTGVDTIFGKIFVNLNEEDQKLFDSILENTKELADLMQETFRNALGFDSTEVSDSIFTGIWDGLKLGQNALGDFSASFGDLMKKALMQSITEGFNLKLTEGWMSDFTELMKGGLTDEERTKLEQDYIKLIQEEQIKVDEVKKITDKYTTTSANAQTSLTGQIKGVSEDTASMIAGRLMAVNNDMKKGLEIGYDSLDVMNMSIGHLDKIQRNTFNTVQELIVSNQKLTEINATLIRNG